MWEITLIGEQQDYMYFLMLEDMLRKKVNSTVVAISGDEPLICSIAVTEKRQLNYVKRCISEIAVRICKDEYFRQNLTILGSDTDLNEFILFSLIAININDEISYVRLKTRFTKVLHIRSLVRFKLNRLYKIWDKYIRYFNYTFESNIDDQIYIEFLKFLARNLSTKEDIMFLEYCEEGVCILDKDKQVLSITPHSDEIGVLVNLIVHAPRKLIVNCFDNLSFRVVNMLQYIFQDRISILL